MIRCLLNEFSSCHGGLILPEHPISDFGLLNILDLLDFQRVLAVDLSFISQRGIRQIWPPPYFPLPRHITFVYRLLHWTGVILLLTFSLCSVGDLRNMERVLLFLHLFLWFPPNLLHPVKGECVRCCRGSNTVMCTHPVLQQFVCFQLLNDVLLGFLFSVENGYCVLVLVIEEPRFQKCETKLLCI